MGIVRKASAAGRFYPAQSLDLSSIIRACFLDTIYGPGDEVKVNEVEKKERRIMGGVCPHAGYEYSGPATARTFKKMYSEGIPDTIIILGNTHTGYDKIGIMKEGKWKTPFGQIQVDTELATKIIENSTHIKEDDSAFAGFPHGREHNIEVQIPFIQYIGRNNQKTSKIVPIKIGTYDYSVLEKIAEEIASVIKSEKGKDIAIIASSDMTHLEPENPDNAQDEINTIQHQKDNAVMDAYEKLDAKLAFDNAQKTTVCGPQTMATLLLTCKKLGATQVNREIYYTSYEKGGEKGYCNYSVGYYAATLEK